MEQLLNILVGAALLLFGRRLYWLFVAAVGFVVGARLATESLGPDAGAWAVWIGLVVGLIGALLSLLLQRVIVGIAGFVAGGYLLCTATLGSGHESWAWLAFVIGGAGGALLILGAFDWALVGLSALVGSTLITQNVPLEPGLSALLFVALLVLGVGAQARQLAQRVEQPET